MAGNISFTVFGCWSVFYFLSLFFLLVGEWYDHLELRAISKTCTSSLFALFGVYAYLIAESAPLWSLVVVLALVFGAVGDVLLIPKESRKMFKVGSYSFLLGHIFYGVAFSLVAWNILWMLIAAGCLVISGWLVFRWLWPEVPSNFRFLVFAYILVESIMILVAVGAAGSGSIALWAIPASVLFYLSDVSVARDRFVKTPNFWNRLWGLPFYFIAQWLFVVTLILGLNVLE